MNRLHYIYDPLCGWCYAAAPLIAAAEAIPGVQIVLHGGGMLTGPNRRAITPQWREYVLPHDLRIARMTGQTFGEAYFEGLLRDTTAVMDSAPPTTAVLVAEAIDGGGLAMIRRIQRAHYVEGRRISDPAVLQLLAKDLGYTDEVFACAFEAQQGALTEQHFQESREWLRRVGGQGFPTLVLGRDDASLTKMEISQWLGRAAEFAEALQAMIAR